MMRALLLVMAAGLATEAKLKPKPNILLLFPDQWRWDWTELNPNLDIHTPNTATLAASGTMFKRAYVAAPVCAPSRACLALGREYDHQMVPSNKYDTPDGATTFYKALRDTAGYHVMVSGKDDLTKHSGYCDAGPPPPSNIHGPTAGLVEVGVAKDKNIPCYNASYRAVELGYSSWLGRTPGKMGTLKPSSGPFPTFLAQNNVTLQNGTVANALFVHDECFGETGLQPNQHLPRTNTTCCLGNICNKPVELPDSMYEDNWVGAKGLEQLKDRPKGQPWFAQINFPGPHAPFIVTPKMMASVAGRKMPQPTDYKGPYSQVDLEISRQTYTAEVENLDQWFGKYIAATVQLGDRSNTIICVSSDHGEMLGDHGDWEKSKPWEGASHVPLVCSGPGVQQSVQIEAPVTTMDMAATWMDVAGIANFAAAGMVNTTSISLWRVLSGKELSNRDFISSGLGQNASGSGMEQKFNFRMVVKRQVLVGGGSEPVTLKYICCTNGRCPGDPSNLPKPAGNWEELLYNVDDDWQEMKPLDLSASANRAVADALRSLLPPQFAAGCSTILPPNNNPFRLVWYAGKNTYVLAAQSAKSHANVSLVHITTGFPDNSVWVVPGAGGFGIAAAAFAGGEGSARNESDGTPPLSNFILESTNLTVMIKHSNTGGICKTAEYPATANILLGPSDSAYAFSGLQHGGGGMLKLQMPLCAGYCLAATGLRLHISLCNASNVLRLAMHPIF